MYEYSDYLIHHGIEGQKWGVKNGPPYPLDRKSLIEKRGSLVEKKQELDERSVKYSSRAAKLDRRRTKFFSLNPFRSKKSLDRRASRNRLRASRLNKKSVKIQNEINEIDAMLSDLDSGLIESGRDYVKFVEDNEIL